MQKIFKSKTFYFGFILSFGIIFVALSNFSRVYVSEAEVLVVFRNEKSAENSEQILENLMAIPKTLSFYSQISKENETEDEYLVSDLPDYKRKEFWNSKLKVKRLGKSGVLKVSVSDKSGYFADLLERETLKNLIESVGKYYDVENEIDLRIIDDPMTTPKTEKRFIFLFIESVFLAFLLSAFSFWISFFLFKEKKVSQKIGSNLLDFGKIWQKKDWPKKDLNTLILEEEQPFSFFKKKGVSLEKKAAAPDNLPVMPESKKEAAPKKEEPIKREPTEEEVKERLNKLLSGKI